MFHFLHQIISPRKGGYEIYDFLTLQMLRTRFGKDRFNSSWEDVNGQAIAKGHPSYSGFRRCYACIVLWNKRSMRKQFQSIIKFVQSYDHYITLMKRTLITFSFLRIKWPLICKKLSLVEIGPLSLAKKMKMWKVYRQIDGRQAIRKAHLSFLLRWAKLWKIYNDSQWKFSIKKASVPIFSDWYKGNNS